MKHTFRSLLLSTVTLGVPVVSLVPACAQNAPNVANSTKNAPLVWQTLNEPGSGGAMTAIRVSPHSSQRILLAGDMLGAGLSTDGGKSWGPTFGFKGYEIADFSWHPSDPNTVWAATMAGPYKSTDGGRNWVEKRRGFPEQVFFGFSAPVERVIFDPKNPNRLLTVGGNSRMWDTPGPRPHYGHVWESLDGGENWQQISIIGPNGTTTNKDEGHNIQAVNFAPDDGQTVYAAMPWHGGFFVSRDGGKTWEKSVAGLPHDAVRRMEVNPKEPNSVVVSLDNVNRDGKMLPGGVYKSSDRGRTWKPLLNGLSQAADNSNNNFTARYNSLAWAPSNPQILYANDTAWNTGVIYRSTNGGQNWQPVATRGNIGQAETEAQRGVSKVETAYFAGLGGAFMTIDPKNENTVWNIGSEHIVATFDGGKTWRDEGNDRVNGAWRGRGFSGLCSMNYGFNPFVKGMAIAQAMDAAKGWVTFDGGNSWKYGAGLDNPNPWGGGNDASFAKDGTIYISTGQHGAFFGVGKSSDGGKSWRVIAGGDSGLPAAGWGHGRHDAEGIFTLPDDSQKVWLVLDGGVMHSQNGGQNWAPLPLEGKFSRFASHLSAPNTVFISGEPNCFLSTDGGKTWENVGGPKKAGRVAADSQGRFYVAVEGENRGGLWRFDPKLPEAQRWTRVFDERWILGVAVDPKNPNRLAVTTNMNPWGEVSRATGVWLSDDGGQSWSAHNQNLAMLRGFAIAFDPHDSQNLVFGSFGRGFYRTTWPQNHDINGTRRYVSDESDAQFALPKESGAVSLVNGAMTNGGDTVDNWGTTWNGGGNARALRDTQTFKEGPASLSVKTEGRATFQVTQTVDVGAGAKFKVSGWIKTRGDVKVNALVQPLRDNWSPISFEQLRYAQGDSDWAFFEKEVTMPAGTVRANIGMLVEGDGQAWLDEVKISK